MDQSSLWSVRTAGVRCTGREGLQGSWARRFSKLARSTTRGPGAALVAKTTGPQDPGEPRSA